MMVTLMGKVVAQPMTIPSLESKGKRGHRRRRPESMRKSGDVSVIKKFIAMTEFKEDTKGFFQIDRRFIVNELLGENKGWTEVEAYLFLLSQCRFFDYTFSIRGISVTLKRGQVAMSVREMITKFGWSQGRVENTLEKWRKKGWIDTQKTNVTTVISIKKGLKTDTQILEQTDTQKTKAISGIPPKKDLKTDTQIGEDDAETDTQKCENNVKTDTQTQLYIKERYIQERSALNARDACEGYSFSSLPTDETTEESCSFEEIWKIYDKQKSKKKAEIAWGCLSDEEKKKATKYIRSFVVLTEKRYRKNLHDFLNDKAFEEKEIDTNGISVPYSTFNPKLVRNELQVFEKFVERFNEKVRGTQIPQVQELTEHRRVLFNIAYCLHFHEIKTVVEKAMTSSRLNGTGNVNWKADFDWIFEPTNFMRIFEGVYDDVKQY